MDVWNVAEEGLWESVLKWAVYQSRIKLKTDKYEDFNGEPPADKKQKLNEDQDNLKLEQLVRDLVPLLCPYIRFGFMEGEYIAKKVRPLNVLSSDELRQGIKDYTDWPTIPQLYVKGEFVGGCDIVKEMFEKGELKKLFEDKSLLS